MSMTHMHATRSPVPWDILSEQAREQRAKEWSGEFHEPFTVLYLCGLFPQWYTAITRTTCLSHQHQCVTKIAMQHVSKSGCTAFNNNIVAIDCYV
jgi:hypothetical protein